MSKKIKKTVKKGKAETKSQPTGNRNTYLALAAIIVIGFIAYSRVFTLDFVSLDDTANILGNKQITAINFTHFKEIFSMTYVQMYAPLTMNIIHDRLPVCRQTEPGSVSFLQSFLSPSQYNSGIYFY